MAELPDFYGGDIRIPGADIEFDRIAANLTVLHIILLRYGGIYEYGNGFPTIGALKKILEHGYLEINIEQLTTDLEQLQFCKFGIVFRLAAGEFGQKQI